MIQLPRGEVRFLLLALVLPALLGFFGAKVIPEMKEVIDNFTDRAKLTAVIQKYGEPGVVPPELTVCDMVKDGVTYYTLESRVDKCQDSPAAVGTVRIFAMGWKGGKIVKFVWGGPKGGKVEY
jgi:hypothetical protein